MDETLQGQIISGAANLVDTGVNIAYNELTHGRDLQEQIDAENRNNAEWTRRVDYENAYNTPFMQSQRLKQAGVNPLQALAGSAPTPGASGSTNSSDAIGSKSLAKLPNLANVYFDSKKLENETKVADATAEKLRAEAEATRGGEGRAQDLHDLIKEGQEILNKLNASRTVGQDKLNEYQDILNYIANDTKQTQIDLVKLSKQEKEYEVKELKDALGTNAQILKNLKLDGNAKAEEIQNLQEQRKILKGQVFWYEIANLTSIREFEYLTGRDYYSQEHVGYGLWQLEYDKASTDVDYGLQLYERAVKENDWFATDKALEMGERLIGMADTIYDDIFDTYKYEDNKKEQRNKEKREDKRKRRMENNKTQNKVALGLLWYALKAFVK